uniref:Si:dkey-7k24.5 n=1 Tax=Neogobius melanostomus TaxID=47308 RepID=A0A8C6UVV1_9GOBI
SEAHTALRSRYNLCACREAGLCCNGRDPACVTKGWKLDRTFGTCFCDQACVSTQDCCDDYQTACPAVSCEVSEWSQWSGCSEPCRAGVRRRSRTILRERQNAADPCPLWRNRRGVLSIGLNKAPATIHWVIPALITSSGYGNARKKRDIPDSEVTGYCVRFQLTSLTAECAQSRGAHTHWMQYLREGHQVCVECQPPALAQGQAHCTGDGESFYSNDYWQPSLQWQAVGNPRCRGLWRRVERLDTCTCPTAHSFLFI